MVVMGTLVGTLIALVAAHVLYLWHMHLNFIAMGVAGILLEQLERQVTGVVLIFELWVLLSSYGLCQQLQSCPNNDRKHPRVDPFYEHLRRILGTRSKPST